MFAVTETGYRAIASAEDLHPGESAVEDVPQDLLHRIAGDAVREQRNAALRATDWTQIPDSPLDASKRAEWAAYRQALRDLSNHPDFPNCPWPTVPETSGESIDLPPTE